MLSTNSNKDYTTLFPFKSLTKIHGRPNFLGLRKIDKELTANASSIQSDLGGGAHGHLGLVKSTAEYAKIAPGNAYNIPTHPGTLRIPPGTSQHEAFRLQQEHYQKVATYCETQDLQKVLLRLLEEAVDREYLTEFRNQQTYTITKPLPEVLATLYKKYGRVKRTDVKTVENEVENMTYDLHQLLSNVWNAIRELELLAEAAKTPYTDEQLCDLALTIIKGTHDFENALTTWIKKPTADKKYANLKTHFDDELALLEEVRGDNMTQPTIHQANLMKLNIADDINLLRDDIMQAIQE